MVRLVVVTALLAAGVGLAAEANADSAPAAARSAVDQRVLTPLDHLCLVGYAMELPWKHSHRQASAQLTQQALAAMAKPLSASASKLFTHALTKPPVFDRPLQSLCSSGNFGGLVQTIALVRGQPSEPEFEPTLGPSDVRPKTPPTVVLDYNGRWAKLIKPSRTFAAVKRGYALAAGLTSSGDLLPPHASSTLNGFEFFKEDEQYSTTVSRSEYGGYVLLRQAAGPGLIYDPHTTIGPAPHESYYDTIGGESSSDFASCLAKADASALAKDLVKSYLEDQILHQNPDPTEETNSATAAAIKESLKALITADCPD